MAKKRARKGTAEGLTGQPPTPSFDELFPTIARWVSQEEGWVELGADHDSRSLARALYGGGMVWEGTDEYGSLDEALRVSFPAPADGGSPISALEYQVGSGAWTDAGTLTSPFLISGLTNGTSYTVRLRADNAVGPGTSSSPESPRSKSLIGSSQPPSKNSAK